LELQTSHLLINPPQVFFLFNQRKNTLNTTLPINAILHTLASQSSLFIPASLWNVNNKSNFATKLSPKQREALLKEKQKERAAKAKARQKAQKQREDERQLKIKERQRLQKEREKKQEVKLKERETKQKEREKKLVKLEKEKKEQQVKEIKKKEKSKELPKRSRSTYVYYVKAQMEIIQKEHPDKPIGERLAIIATKWHTLSEEEKKPYSELAEQDKKRRDNEYAELKKKSPPKRPLTAFILFSNEHRMKIQEDNPTAKFSELGLMLANKWKSLTTEERENYEKQSEKLKQEYTEELAKFNAEKSS